MNLTSNCFVSAIIPVYNDSFRLKKCLKVLQNQTYPKELYEVIVVDNNSEEDIASIVAEFSQVKIIHEIKPGSYPARNKGISIAKGEVIAFIDSDCLPGNDWIEKGVENLFKVDNCGLVAGKIEIFFQDSHKPTAVEVYESLNAFNQKHYIEDNHWGATANVFTFKSVIQDVGMFDDTLKSGGDVEWGQRIFAAGYQQIYGEDCVVYHPARRSFKQLHKKIVRVNGGMHDIFQNIHKYPHLHIQKKQDFWSSVIRGLRPPIKSIVHIIRDNRLHQFTEKLQVIYVLLFVRYVSTWERFRLQFSGESRR